MMMMMKSFLRLKMCQELQIFAVCIYVLGCKLRLVRLCGSDFGITPVDDITIGITCAAFCFHIAHISFASSWYSFFFLSSSSSSLLLLLLLLLLRSRWPRGLRSWSEATRFLGLRVQFSRVTWMSLCCDCCVLSGRGLCDGLITRP